MTTRGQKGCSILRKVEKSTAGESGGDSKEESRTMIYVYPATIQHEEDGRYSIWFEDLPGCATSGIDLPDALAKARDAMGLWLDGASCYKSEKGPKP